MDSGRGTIPVNEGVGLVVEPFGWAPKVHGQTGEGRRGQVERGAEREAIMDIRGGKRVARDSVRREGDEEVLDGAEMP